MGEKQFNIKKLLYKGLRYWYLFITIPPMILAAAYFYLKYTMPTYQSEAMILIKDDENSGAPTEEIVFTELGMGKKNKTLENETLILKSTPVLIEVVKKLDLQYEYTAGDGFKKTALYKSSPIQVLAWKPLDERSELLALVHDNGRGGYRLLLDKQEFNGEFGKEMQLPGGTLTLSHKPGQFADFPLQISIIPPLDMARGIADKLKVEIMGELSSTLHLSIKDISPLRARDILGTLMDVYNQTSIEIKNKAYENTINMVNERIKMMEDNLERTELNYEAYKRNNQSVDMSAEGTLLMTELATSNKELSDKRVQMEILNSVEDFLIRNQSKFEFVPTNINLNNLTLTNQLTTFNELLRNREKLYQSAGAAHPDLVLTEHQINNLRETIIDNIRSIKSDLVIANNASQGFRSNLEDRLSSLPRRERQLAEIEREKNLKENLYLYLLQKREQAAVSLAVTAAKGRIVEPAEPVYSPVSPKRSQIWLIALFMSFAIPIGIVFFIESLNDKVMSEEDIVEATSVPLAGTLGQSRKKGHIVVTENSRSAVAEMFRLLRANLAYIAPGQDLKTVLVTSSTSGEGKSFIAINLGMTMALAGKKVLIIELDLRKPKQEQYTGVERSDDGLVNYLISGNMKPYQVIRNTGLHARLDLISSGAIPPNPGELILSARLRELVDKMRDEYDFIILDAPPVGRVADALQMKDLAEATMYVVRTNYTRKGQLEIIEDIAQKGKMPRPFIVLNGIPTNKPGGSYSYGYGYGHGKGYGYYQEDEEVKKPGKVKAGKGK
ncbi:MAG: polysaccharide biosynthesis tyrosine autokinase [Saprospiraceae bacterium]|nr:polysaccharide biosynthesis tyrosine autokinase [Saprospiraceae bacterium]